MKCCFCRSEHEQWQDCIPLRLSPPVIPSVIQCIECKSLCHDSLVEFGRCVFCRGAEDIKRAESAREVEGLLAAWHGETE